MDYASGGDGISPVANIWQGWKKIIAASAIGRPIYAKLRALIYNRRTCILIGPSARPWMN